MTSALVAIGVLAIGAVGFIGINWWVGNLEDLAMLQLHQRPARRSSMATPFSQLLWSDPQTYNYLAGQGSGADRATLQCIHDDVIVDATDTNTIAEWTGNQQQNPHPDGVLIAIEQNPDTSPNARTILHNCGVQYVP